ncbi:MAG: small acid-soluble spore protein SspI [Paenibacillaceae bacterium]
MKTLSLRQAIIQRIQNKSNEQLIEVVDGSIGSDEMALPGLGVIFEMIWQHIDEQQKHDLASALNETLANKPRI